MDEDMDMGTDTDTDTLSVCFAFVPAGKELLHQPPPPLPPLCEKRLSDPKTAPRGSGRGFGGPRGCGTGGHWHGGRGVSAPPDPAVSPNTGTRRDRGTQGVPPALQVTVAVLGCPIPAQVTGPRLPPWPPLHPTWQWSPYPLHPYSLCAPKSLQSVCTPPMHPISSLQPGPQSAHIPLTPIHPLPAPFLRHPHSPGPHIHLPSMHTVPHGTELPMAVPPSPCAPL